MFPLKRREQQLKFGELSALIEICYSSTEKNITILKQDIHGNQARTMLHFWTINGLTASSKDEHQRNSIYKSVLWNRLID